MELTQLDLDPKDQPLKRGIYVRLDVGEPHTPAKKNSPLFVESDDQSALLAQVAFLSARPLSTVEDAPLPYVWRPLFRRLAERQFADFFRLAMTLFRFR